MKKRRQPTRGGGRRGGGRLPSDIVDAAEAALDDMLARTDDIDDEDILEEEQRTETRSPQHKEYGHDDDDEILGLPPKPAVSAVARSSKMPLPAPPRTTSVQTLRPSPAPAGKVVPHPHLAARGSPSPSRQTPPPSRPTPTGPPTPRPAILGEYTEAPTHAVVDETAPIPDEMIVDLQSAPVVLPPEIDTGLERVLESVATEDAIPQPFVISLQVAVFEESAHLGSLQSTITAAGHTVLVAATGRDGVSRVLDTLADGETDVVIAAMPGGEKIVEAALALEPRPIVVASFGCAVLDAIRRAHDAGADLALTRPHEVERIAPMMLAAARLRAEQGAARAARVADDDGESRSLLALDVFQRVIEREINRAKRFEYPLSIALFTVEVDPPEPPSFIRGIRRARAGNALIHAIRDIDMATQLDDERLLVLMPYTDLKGAAAVGRRIVTAVAGGDPVISAGRRFPPRVVGAIAGAKPGQPVTYTKLMKDAARTLEQARRDGAELAVQP